MRIEDLDPRWKAGVLVIDCPCGKCGGRLRIPTQLFVDTAQICYRWTVSGEFPNLSFYPSVDAGCWHGWIRNGVVTSV